LVTDCRPPDGDHRVAGVPEEEFAFFDLASAAHTRGPRGYIVRLSSRDDIDRWMEAEWRIEKATKATHQASYCIADSKRHLLLVELDAEESFPDICRRAAETMGEANPPAMVGMVIGPPLIIGAPDGGCSTVRPIADAVRAGIPARLSQARHAGPWCTGRFRELLRVSTCEDSDHVEIHVSGTDTGDDFVYSKSRDELVSIARYSGSRTLCYGDPLASTGGQCVPSSVLDCAKGDGGR
jgi:hypothetical protein